MREEGVYLQPGFIRNPAMREHFLPPLHFLCGWVSLWFSWSGRKGVETASCFWGLAVVPGTAKLPWHVLCPSHRERAAPSPLPALEAGEPWLPASQGWVG